MTDASSPACRSHDEMFGRISLERLASVDADLRIRDFSSESAVILSHPDALRKKKQSWRKLDFCCGGAMSHRAVAGRVRQNLLW